MLMIEILFSDPTAADDRSEIREDDHSDNPSTHSNIIAVEQPQPHELTQATEIGN